MHKRPPGPVDVSAHEYPGITVPDVRGARVVQLELHRRVKLALDSPLHLDQQSTSTHLPDLPGEYVVGLAHALGERRLVLDRRREVRSALQQLVRRRVCARRQQEGEVKEGEEKDRWHFG